MDINVEETRTHAAWHPFYPFNPWSEIKSVSSVKSVGAVFQSSDNIFINIL